MGTYDGFIRKYDTEGMELWTRQFGTAEEDHATGVGIGVGGILVTGYTMGSLGGPPSGDHDIFVRKHDMDGKEQWTRQFGSNDQDLPEAIVADSSGIYVAGSTNGALPGQTSEGATEGFLAKLNEAVEPPFVFEGGVVSAASFALHPAPVAPGTIAAIFGNNLNNRANAFATNFGPDGKLGTTLGGASVKINGTPAPMFASIHTPSYDQLTVQIPFEVAGQTSAVVEVTTGGQTSPPRTFFLDTAAPGIFTVNQQGSGAGIVTHLDTTLVTEQNPAHPNEFVVLYATGLGVLSPPLATGARSSGNATAIPATVTVDGMLAEVLFSGSTPGLVGLNQVNVQIPASTRSAPDIAVVLRSGVKQSNTVTIAVSP
jgi:uncharacterized protein (TIGR03437 family)